MKFIETLICRMVMIVTHSIFKNTREVIFANALVSAPKNTMEIHLYMNVEIATFPQLR